MEVQRADPMFTVRFMVRSWRSAPGSDAQEGPMNPVPLLVALAVKALLEWLMSDD